MSNKEKLEKDIETMTNRDIKIQTMVIAGLLNEILETLKRIEVVANEKPEPTGKKGLMEKLRLKV